MATMVPPIPTADDKKVDQKVDYSNLPCPIPFEELHREAMSLFSFSLNLFYFFFIFYDYTQQSQLISFLFFSVVKT